MKDYRQINDYTASQLVELIDVNKGFNLIHPEKYEFSIDKLQTAKYKLVVSRWSPYVCDNLTNSDFIKGWISRQIDNKYSLTHFILKNIGVSLLPYEVEDLQESPLMLKVRILWINKMITELRNPK